ncbi:MAG: cytochrome P450 [Candidatus Nanopelagicaceae bacterium]|nr:cytochrome P450 [Candidatus Nanopelagicaceae bacterium]
MIDLKDPEFISDPYPFLARLRAEGKPIWHEGLGIYLAATHKDASEVLRNKSLGRIYVDREPESDWQTFNWLHSESILESEPPKHTRLRGLISKAFNRNRIESLRPKIEEIVKELLDELTNGVPSFDLIADYAEPLPVRIIAELLGFPRSEERLLRPWSQAIVKMYEVSPSDLVKQEARKAASEFSQYVHELMLARKANPGSDLISELAQVEEAGERLSAHELIATCVLLLNAGHEASVNGFGNGMVALLNNQEQRKLLFRDPDKHGETAIEEFLRFDSPLQLFERTAKEDVEIGGVMIREGEKIASLLGAANRDGSIFANPDSMDITRSPNPHISFGGGIHFCIGAPLARLEMSIALPSLIKHFPNLELSGEPKRRDSFTLRGYERVEVIKN